MEETKNICCAKDEGAVDQNTTTSSRNFDNQAWSSRHKIMDSEAP